MQVRKFLTLIKEKDNVQIVKEEIRAIQGKYGPAKSEPKFPAIPCPYTTFLLASAWNVDLEVRNLTVVDSDAKRKRKQSSLSNTTSVASISDTVPSLQRWAAQREVSITAIMCYHCVDRRFGQTTTMESPLSTSPIRQIPLTVL